MLISLCLISLFSQAETTTVSGSVTNASETDTVRLVVDTTYIELNEMRFKEGLDDSDFKFEFDLTENTIAEFLVNKTKIHIYLEPGDALQLNFDKDSLATKVAFDGEGAKNNEFLFKFNETFAGQFDKYATEEEMKSENLDIFEMTHYDQLQKQQSYLKDNLDKFEQSKGFQEYIKNQVRYNYLGSMVAFPIIRANDDPAKTEVDPLPRVVLESLKPEWINNETAMVSPRYRYFVENYVVYKTSELNEFKKFQNYTNSVESKYVYARQNIQDAQFKYFLAKYLHENYDRVKPSTVRWIYNHLKEIDNSNKYHEKINEIVAAKMLEEDPIEEVVEVEEESASSSEVYMKDMEGNALDFKDFKGKVVYVDFWASWCGPCRSQFPHAAKLKEQLMMELSKKEKEKIVFLYISIDDTESGWKGAVKKLEMTGFQAHSPGGWGSKVVKMFNISGIPRYMLINKKGEFVDEQAKRPSDPSILGTLLELIRE